MVFDTIVQRGVGVLLLGAIAYLLLRLFVFKSKQKYTWVDTEMFNKQLEQASEGCTESGLLNFINFLRVYEGEYIKRQKGKIVFEAYSEREKEALKNFFEKSVIPSGYASIKTKETFRKLIISRGVTGLESRPNYEGREHKVTIPGIVASSIAADKEKANRNILDETDEKIKKILENELDSKKYFILNKAEYTVGEETTKYDFFVVGENGAFAFETGALEELANFLGTERTTLTIETGDIWHLVKGNEEKIMTSPTEKLNEQQIFLDNIVGDLDVVIHPVLVLPDSNLNIVKRTDLPYEVISPRNIISFIRNYNDPIDLRNRMELTERLSELKR